MPAWSDNIPRFDELYSVSDLHMGGAEPGSQIFNSGPELAGLIEFLRAKPGMVALVINGDMVDFLAEPGGRHSIPAVPSKNSIVSQAMPPSRRSGKRSRNSSAPRIGV